MIDYFLSSYVTINNKLGFTWLSVSSLFCSQNIKYTRIIYTNKRQQSEIKRN